jgi:hypothetical protein
MFIFSTVFTNHPQTLPDDRDDDDDVFIVTVSGLSGSHKLLTLFSCSNNTQHNTHTRTYCFTNEWEND